MRTEGNIMCVTDQGELIARFPKTPKMGSPVLDKKKKIIGKISWIFGPADDPYVEIKLNKEPKKRLSILNENIYVEEI